MSYQILQGDCRQTLAQLADKTVQTCITSPPYFGLRDYGHEGQIGQEQTPQAFVAELVDVFRGVRRVLKDNGTVWLNLGDSYSSGGNGGGAEGTKQATNVGALLGPKKTIGYGPKQLLGIPWRVALALQDDGWYLRQDIIWHKPNPMPESVTDRCTKAHEYIFLLSKSPKYYFDAEAIREESSPSSIARAHLCGGTPSPKNLAGVENGVYAAPMSTAKSYGQGRNKRSVWTVATQPYAESHFATFPPDLIEPCILAGSRHGDLVLDPFNGSGTTGQVALQWQREYVGCELNPEYIELTHKRLRRLQLQMFV